MSSQSASESPRRKSRSRSRDRQHHNRQNKIKIKVPELSEPLFSFKHFSTLQGERLSNEDLQKGYQKYRKSWQQHQHEQFIKQYKKDAWFSEKYDPQLLDFLQKNKKEQCLKNAKLFFQNFEKGLYDTLQLSIADPTVIGVIQKIEDEDELTRGLLSNILQVRLIPNFDITAPPYFGFDADKNALFIPAIPRNISRYDIINFVQKMTGYRTMTMSDPVKKMNLTRYCWIQFDSKQNTQQAQLMLSGLMIKETPLTVSKAHNKGKRVRLFTNYPLSRLEADLATVKKLVKTLDKEAGITQNPLIDHDFVSYQKQFDTLLLYLRKAHAYDYFSASGHESQRMLTVKTACLCLRTQTSEPQSGSCFAKIAERAQQRVRKGNPAPDYMGMLRQQIQVFLRESQKTRRDQEKQVWKCLYCDKKFMSCDFLAKHIIAKHEEIKFKFIQVVMEKLYLRDPHKITFALLSEREKQRYKRGFYKGAQRKERKPYRDLDEPENDKTNKKTAGQTKQLVNFLDI